MKYMMISLTVMLIFATAVPLSIVHAGFMEDIDGHWGEEHIVWAVYDVPVFSGYPDGSFQPDGQITRAEFMTVLTKLLEKTGMQNGEEEQLLNHYRDLSEDHWSYTHISRLAHYLRTAPLSERTLTDIFEGREIRPSEPITRKEAALLTRGITTPPVDLLHDREPHFDDLDPEDPEDRSILELAANQIISGYEDGTFRPENHISRAEAASLARKINNDRAYLKPDLLSFQSMMDEEPYPYPTLDMPSQTANYTEQDWKMDNVIVTLEYMTIAGFIPYDERDLYDLTPVDTLWTLKEEEYPRTIATHYYLIRHDSDLREDQKRDLANQALRRYLEKETKELDGFRALASTVVELADARLVIQSIDRYLQTNPDTSLLYELKMLKNQRWLNEGEAEKAAEEYRPLIERETDAKKKMMLIHNKVIAWKHGHSHEQAIDVLEQYWNKLRETEGYGFHQEEIENHFTALMKQLMIDQ